MWRQKGERKDRTSLLPSGMKMVGNGRENPQTVIVLVFFWPGTGAGMGKTDGKTNSILRDIGNGNYGSGTYQLRWENINYGREHDTCNHFKHLARHHVYITLTHHQVDNTVQAAQVRNKEKNTTWAARQQQPVADSGGRRSTPVAWISDLAPRRRHCLPLLSPRRWIPGHRGGGGLATFGMGGLGDFRGSEVGGDADLG
jgi:hypothetical protein